MVDGRTLWILAASVEVGDGGAPTRIRSANGEYRTANIVYREALTGS